MPPSSRGLGHFPFTEVTGIRIPLGVLKKNKLTDVYNFSKFILPQNGVVTTGYRVCTSLPNGLTKPSVNIYTDDPSAGFMTHFLAGRSLRLAVPISRAIFSPPACHWSV